MVDFWFGEGAFGKMLEPLTAYLIKETASNIKDVRATFRENYSERESLNMPTLPLDQRGSRRGIDRCSG